MDFPWVGPGSFIVPPLEPLWPLSAKCLMLSSSVRGCTEVRVCGKARSPGERRVVVWVKKATF